MDAPTRLNAAVSYIRILQSNHDVTANSSNKAEALLGRRIAEALAPGDYLIPNIGRTEIPVAFLEILKIKGTDLKVKRVRIFNGYKSVTLKEHIKLPRAMVDYKLTHSGEKQMLDNIPFRDSR